MPLKSFFADPNLFTHADFTFNKIAGESTIDEFGNPVKSSEQIKVKFALIPKNLKEEQTPGSTFNEQHYYAYVLDQQTEAPSTIPPGIEIDSVGTGSLNNRPCRARIVSLGQSLANSMFQQHLGEKVELALAFDSRSIGGN